MRKQAAIIGGGVIGGGWAARFALMGWDVRVYDPDPEAERKINAVMANAERALPMLFEAPMPRRGNVRFCDTIADAVDRALWVQESVPEVLAVKKSVLQQVVERSSAKAIITLV